MRRHFAPILLALLAVTGLIASGCGGESPAEKAQESIADQQKQLAPSAADAKKTTEEAHKQLDQALKEAKARAKDKKSAANNIDSVRQIRAFDKIRKACIKKVQSNKETNTQGDTARSLAACNRSFKTSVIAAKKQAKLVTEAYPECLKQAKAEKNAKKREIIMNGCASIPH